jgi:tetratricopeptide (TPR) repeat protein
VIELVLALPDGRKDEVGKHLLRLDGVDEEVVDVAEACVDEEDWSAVAAIAEAYRGRRPDTPLSAFYEGRAQLARGRTEDAVASFERARDRAGTDAERGVYEEWFYAAGVAAGRALEQFEQARDVEGAFRAIASELADTGDYATLATLVARYEKSSGGGGALHLWNAVLALRDGRSAHALALVDEHADAMREAAGQAAWRVEDVQVRALVRLGKIDLARAHAKSPVLRLLVAAASGVPAAAIPSFGAALDEGEQLEDLYADRDLGPLLRAEAMAPLREKFPPPE